ncbi:MAG: PEP-CTERM sorting domain-containing protein [Pirellulaceae bacterium]
MPEPSAVLGMILCGGVASLRRRRALMQLWKCGV